MAALKSVIAGVVVADLTIGERAIGESRRIGRNFDRLAEIGDRFGEFADFGVGDAARAIGFGAVRIALHDLGQGGDIGLRLLRRLIGDLGDAGPALDDVARRFAGCKREGGERRQRIRAPRATASRVWPISR